MNTSITAFAPMWIRCSAWPALQVATAPLVVALLLGSLFVGPQGMEVRDLGIVAESYSGVAVAILLIWSLAMAPAALLALTAPGLRYLRWLPIPAWFGMAHLALVLLVLQAPMPILLVFAGKPALALGLWGAGLGLSACLLLPSQSRLESLQRLGIALVIASLLIVAHALLAGALGVLAALFVLPRQYRRAAQPSRRRARPARIGGPRLALLGLQVLRLWRCESAALLRAVLLAGLGAGMVLLVNRANLGQAWSTRMLATLVAATPAFALIATIVALALRRGQEEMQWLRNSLGISTSRLRRASLLVLLGISFGLALLLTGVALDAAHIASFESANLVALLAVHGGFWASISSLLSYRVVGRGSDQSPAMWVLCIALANMLLVGLTGPWFLVIEGSLSLLIVMRMLSFDGNEERGRA